MKTENLFPYQIKKEYLSKARIFKVLAILYICAYLGAIISFAVIAYPLNKETSGFLVWMACFGFAPILILRNLCKKKLDVNISLPIGQEHKWICGSDCDSVMPEEPKEKKSFFQKLLKDKIIIQEKGPAFDFFDILKKFNIYGNIRECVGKSYYLGTHFDRLFRLDYIELLNIFSSYKNGRYYFVNFRGFILRTIPTQKIKSTILIRPKSFFAKKIKELKKVETDPQNLFEIYSDNPQNLKEDLSSEFMSALIAYAKEIDKTITILITPEGILCTKPDAEIKDFFAPVLFRSLKKAFIREWAKYENFINLLELFNLLEKEK